MSECEMREPCENPGVYTVAAIEQCCTRRLKTVWVFCEVHAELWVNAKDMHCSECNHSVHFTEPVRLRIAV